MRTLIEKYLHFMKNCIRPPYKKLKTLKSGIIENSNFENNRDPCRGHPYYTSGDVPTGRPGQSELSGSAKSRGNSGFPCSMLMVIIFIPPSANFCEATYAILIWSAIFEGEMLTDNFLCSRTVAFHRK